MSELAQLHADAFEGTAARVATLLSAFLPVDRVRPRRLDDPELLAFAGKSRGGLYRLIEARALVPERAPVPGSHCYLTLAAVAEWRASRTHPENEKASGSTEARRRTNARAETTLPTFARQA